MKGQIVAILSLLFTGCITSRQLSEGMYRKVFSNEVVYTLIIQPNDSFTYRWFTGMSSGKETGVYEKLKSCIILNGGTFPAEKSYIFESFRNDSDSVYVEMVDFAGRPIYMGVAIIDGKGTVTDLDGKSIIRKDRNVEMIEVKYLSLNVKYQVQKNASNYFVIKLDTEIKDQVYFKDVKVKIKHEKLIMRDPRLLASMVLKKVR